jgi:membrane glycosyltransferase
MDARLMCGEAAAPFEPAAAYPVCPPDALLAMPQQPASAERVAAYGESRHWRLAALVIPALAVTALAAGQSYVLMSEGGMTPLEWVALVLLAVNLAWVSSAAATAVAGAVVLLMQRPGGRMSAPFSTTSRTAIIFPIRNEQPGGVMGGAQAVHDALANVHADKHFEIFFLSDTADPVIAHQEETAFHRLRESRPDGLFFYRRREINHGRKAGNVADFVRRWGGRYDYMVVFDADSLMSAEALRRLVQRMDASPSTALIQTLPVIVNAQTLFARTQQFAMRAYGQIFGAGLAWWSANAGNFWGHNAIIRVRAFAAHAGLPVLQGKGLLGGEILSHDFIEAALLRRAGWRVEIAPDIAGSYEECPPTPINMAERDRRWAQGNLQHLRLLFARGFDPVSRAHFLVGMMGYLSAPFWFALVIASVGLGWLQNPAADAGRASSGLFLLTALIVLSPKWLALLLWTSGRLPGWSRHPRFIAGLAVETAVSAFTAPILMVNQTVAVFSAVFGRDAGWHPQVRRCDGQPSQDLGRHYAMHLAIGLALCAAVLAHDAGLTAWTAPVMFSLVLAAPLSAALSQQPRQRNWLWRIMSTPEETNPPSVIRSARRIAMRLGVLHPARWEPSPQSTTPLPSRIVQTAEAGRPGA